LNGNDKRTEDWKLYEAGKQYNNKLKYYETVDANLAFYHGDQWRNLDVANMPKPVMNIIKRIIGFFVSSLTTSKAKLHFEPLILADTQDKRILDEKNAADMANAQISNLLEKLKFDFRTKDILFDGAITGDGCLHFFFDMSKKPYGNVYADILGEIDMEIVDGSNVYFGNANNSRVDIQPYIIVSGRDMVKNLKEEAKRYRTDQEEIDNILSDYSYQEQAGDSGKLEVDVDVQGDEYGKALYIIVYRKKKVKRPKVDEYGQPLLDENGQPIMEEHTTITASKSVENAYIYKDIDTGLSEYPIAWFNWERQKQQYHGRAVCTGILPNQIFINRMFAMIMYHLMTAAFPKAVYNADLIQTWNNEIGSAIGVRGLGQEVNISNVAGYLKPGDMSNQIVQVIELAMQYTKETIGISDASLGNIDPKNTSATIAVQKSSAIPLENPKSNLYEFIEDVGRILFDMMGTYYGNRPVVITDKDGNKQLVEYDFSEFKNMWLNIKADVGESSYWSEISALQTLDNLLASDRLDFLQYLERVPDEYIPAKQELISEIKKKLSMANDPNNLIAQLSPEEQQAFLSAPPEQQQAILAQLQQPQQAPMM
jgi:hypothetical protein